MRSRKSLWTPRFSLLLLVLVLVLLSSLLSLQRRRHRRSQQMQHTCNSFIPFFIRPVRKLVAIYYRSLLLSRFACSSNGAAGRHASMPDIQTLHILLLYVLCVMENVSLMGWPRVVENAMVLRAMWVVCCIVEWCSRSCRVSCAPDDDDDVRHKHACWW